MDLTTIGSEVFYYLKVEIFSILFKRVRYN